MKHWLDEDNMVHADGASGDDRTLCGVILEGIEGRHQMIETDARVDCGHCIGIVEHCRKIRAGEYVATQRSRR